MMTRFCSWKSTQMSRNSSDTQAKRRVSEPEMVVVCAGGSLFVIVQYILSFRIKLRRTANDHHLFKMTVVWE